MADPFNNQLIVGGGNVAVAAEKKTPMQRRQDALAPQQGSMSSDSYEDKKAKADAAKKKYMQDNGVDENGDPVSKSGD